MADINTTFGNNTYLINEMIQKPQVLSEKILKSQSICCSITMPDPIWEGNVLKWDTITIPFYMSDDFSFGLSNEWSSLINQDGMFGSFTNLLNGLSTFTGSAQVTMQSQGMSAACWNGSKFEGFNLQCLFICTNRRINPVTIIEKLCKTCLPAKLRDYTTKTGVTPPAIDFLRDTGSTFLDFTTNFINDTMPFTEQQKQNVTDVTSQIKNQLSELGMVAPLNYGVQLDSNYQTGVKPLPGTTVALHIGDYFHASELLVDSISGIRFSKELIAPVDYSGTRGSDLYKPENQGTEYGFPLYATCQIRLRPFCLVDLKTFQQYFIQQPASSANVSFYNNESEVLPQ